MIASKNKCQMPWRWKQATSYWFSVSSLNCPDGWARPLLSFVWQFFFVYRTKCYDGTLIIVCSSVWGGQVVNKVFWIGTSVLTDASQWAYTEELLFISSFFFKKKFHSLYLFPAFLSAAPQTCLRSPSLQRSQQRFRWHLYGCRLQEHKPLSSHAWQRMSSF